MTAKAAGNNTLAKEARGRAKAFRSAYDDLCDKIGLQPTLERMQIGKYQGETVDFGSKSGIIKVDKTISGHNGNPKKSNPNTIIDHTMNGKVDARAFYGESGMKEKDIHTTNHGNPKTHNFGENGEHAHDYTWDNEERLINKTSREITEKERKENSDIL